jgi:serine protease Do
MTNRPVRQRTSITGIIPLLLLLAGSCFGAGTSSASASDLRRTAMVLAVEKARPAVVNIQGRKTVRSEPSDEGGAEAFRQVNGMGTGILVDSRGYILTNYHVVENVESIRVTTFDKQAFVARLVAHDPVTDLAIIRIDAPNPLPVVEVGTADDLMLAEPVIAVGNAFGYEHTVTSGMISALHRDVQVSASQKYNDLIQTDASINPGNSGGPLLNIDGQMIGINVAVRVGAQGIGFAMPVDEAVEVAARLLNAERIGGVKHGIAGETKVLSADRCFHVTKVAAGSAAAEAGLRPGDIIAKVDDAVVKRRLDFERAMLGRRSGGRVSLTVTRAQETLALELTLPSQAALANSQEDRIWSSLGVKIATVAADEIRRTRSPYRGGMRIVSVRSDGPAAAQGIRAGDVLVGLHVWETVSQENVLYILNHPDFDKFQPLKFYVVRGKETLYGHMQVNRGQVLQVSRRVDPER